MSEKAKLSFEAALRALEEEVACLERGDLPLDEALQCFEAGVKNVTLCRQYLQVVETRVEMLMKDRDGTLRVQDFEEE